MVSSEALMKVLFTPASFEASGWESILEVPVAAGQPSTVRTGFLLAAAHAARY
jgi:hypothetical protein